MGCAGKEEWQKNFPGRGPDTHSRHAPKKAQAVFLCLELCTLSTPPVQSSILNAARPALYFCKSRSAQRDAPLQEEDLAHEMRATTGHICESCLPIGCSILTQQVDLQGPADPLLLPSPALHIFLSLTTIGSCLIIVSRCFLAGKLAPKTAACLTVSQKTRRGSICARTRLEWRCSTDARTDRVTA